jgi:hypothetical protein
MKPFMYRLSAIYINLADDIFSLSVASFCSYTVVNGYGRYRFFVFFDRFFTLPFIEPFVF